MINPKCCAQQSKTKQTTRNKDKVEDWSKKQQQQQEVQDCRSPGLKAVRLSLPILLLSAFPRISARRAMSCGPGGANASSAAQPAATESVEIISAAQPVDTYSCCRLDVRWQVEHSGKWWDIPQSATIDWFYTESAPGVTYNYDWGTAGSVAMSSIVRSVSR